MPKKKAVFSVFPNARFPWRTFSLSFEMIPGMVLAVVGIWLILPMQTMSDASPVLNLMTKALIEPIWGFIFFVPGMFQLRVLWLGPLHIRKTAAVCAFIFLFFLLVLAALESPTSLLIPILFVLAFFEAVTVRRLKKSITVIEAIAQKEEAISSRGLLHRASVCDLRIQKD